MRRIGLAVSVVALVPAVNKLVARILGDPQVPKIIVDGFEHLRGDPKLAGAVEQLLDHW